MRRVVGGSHSDASIAQWQGYKRNYESGKWRGGTKKFKERLRAYLGSIVLGRNFQEDVDAYLDRTGKTEFYVWAENELKE